MPRRTFEMTERKVLLITTSSNLCFKIHNASKKFCCSNPKLEHSKSQAAVSRSPSSSYSSSSVNTLHQQWSFNVSSSMPTALGLISQDRHRRSRRSPVSHLWIPKCPPLPSVCFLYKINTVCRYKGTGRDPPVTVRPAPRSGRLHAGLEGALLSPLSASDVRFDFVQRVVNFCQSLFDAQGCQPGRRVLVPALLHQLSHGR